MKKLYNVLITVTLLVFIFICFLATHVFDIKDMTASNGSIRDYNDGWVLVRPDGSEVAIGLLPYSEPSKAGEVFYLNRTINKEDAGNTIRFLSADKLLSITLDGDAIYEFGTEDRRLFGKTPGSITNFVELPDDIGNGELSMKMVSPYDNYASNISQMVIGKANIVELDLIKQNLFNYVICMIILFTALMLIIMELIELFSKQGFTGKIYLGIICLFGAAYHAIETKSLNIFFGNQTLYSILVFIVIMVLPTLMCLYYIFSTENEKYRKRFEINYIVCLINIVVQLVIQVFNIADFMVTAPLSHAIIAVTVVNIDVALVQINIEQYKKTNALNKSMIFEMIGITSIMLGSMIDIIRFYVTPVGDMGKYGRIGMLIFSIITLVIHIRMISVRYLDQVNQNMQIMQIHIHEVEEANAAKTRFLANMSHEIRTPMNSILGFSEILLTQDLSEENKEYVANIRESSDSLLSIVNDILNISKIETGKMEIVENEFEIKHLLKGVCVQIKTLADKKGLEFKTEFNPSLPTKLYGDEVRIREVLLNVLNNAVKYTLDGHVLLSVGTDEIADGITMLSVMISDTGIGISPKNQDLIFHAFEQVDIKKNHGIEGTGLGLAIVRTYIDLMHGQIEVDSDVGKGSTFTIRIPLTVVDDTPIGVFTYDRDEKPKSKISDIKIDKKVLVVDDSIVNLKVIGRALQHYGITVETADSGEKSIELCKENKYDIVLMDQMMPVMDGVEAMQKIREIPGYEAGGNIKIVALTANAIDGVEEELINEGFDRYLKKPVEFDKLEMVLTES